VQVAEAAYSIIKGNTVDIWCWAPLDEVESAALAQLRNVAGTPWVYHHVAAMPDVHLGKGATIGSVIATRGGIMPAAVGVDIGCGVLGLRLDITKAELPANLGTLRSDIEAAVPVGFSMHADDRRARQSGPWDRWPLIAPLVPGAADKVRRQFGTLGGGNHFLELNVDPDEQIWILLHSGSRWVGNELSTHYTKLAYAMPHNQGLPDRDLAALLDGTQEMDGFLLALDWAQQYAWESRLSMGEQTRQVVERIVGREIDVLEAVHCHHNYAAVETHYGESVYLTRKGAISARSGERGVIPGSMGTGSYVVEGLGNPGSFCSAAHGAGRRMGRKAAKRQFTLDDLAAQTSGIECRKDKGVLDEIPGAYKDIHAVMAQQADLARPLIHLRPILCVKG
jgi:tRNA-splicing ligase RtcB